jgi:uncharacterized protein (DUF58 family)
VIDLYVFSASLLIAMIFILSASVAYRHLASRPFDVALASGSVAAWLGFFGLMTASSLLLAGIYIVKSDLHSVVALIGLLAALVLLGILLSTFIHVRRLNVVRRGDARRERFRLTRHGLTWLAVATTMGIVGWLRGLNLVLLLAYLMLLIWGLNYLLAGRGLYQLRARRRIDGPVFAQTPFVQEVSLENTVNQEIVGVRLVDRGLYHALGWFVHRLPPGETVRFSEETVQPRRCRYPLGPLSAVSGYPFGLIERSAIVGKDEDLIVLPSLGQLQRHKLKRFLDQGAAGQGWQRRRPRPRPALATEFHGIRPYQHGDSPRWIHWRTSARRGELMVREFEEAQEDNLILVLDPWLPEVGPASRAGPSAARLAAPTTVDLLEEAISLAATICWEWCRQKGDRFTLATAGATPLVIDGVTSREHALRMLEELAVIPDSVERCWDQLRNCLTQSALPAGPVLVVSCSPSELGDLLSRDLRRPVVQVNAGELSEYDFYERPQSREA